MRQIFSDRIIFMKVENLANDTSGKKNAINLSQKITGTAYITDIIKQCFFVRGSIKKSC